MFHVEQWQGKVRGFFLLCKEGSEETPTKTGMVFGPCLFGEKWGMGMAM
ncbi:MAG: hypothetical protein ACI4KC_09510 [Gemmiger sp.]